MQRFYVPRLDKATYRKLQIMLIPLKGVLSSIFIFLGVMAHGQDILNPYDTLIAKGIEAVKVGDLEPAKDFFYAALEMMPEGITPNYMLGYCYSKDCYDNNEKCDLSISFLDKAIRIDKFYRFPFYNRALSKYKQGDLTGALADIDTQIEMDSTDPSYILLRARIYHKLDNKEGTCNNLHWLKNSTFNLSTAKDLLSELEEYCRE